MKENGKMECVRATAPRHGQTGANMPANGLIIKQMERESSIIQTEMSIKENGLMIRPMAMALTPTQMEPNM